MSLQAYVLGDSTVLCGVHLMGNRSQHSLKLKTVVWYAGYADCKWQQSKCIDTKEMMTATFLLVSSKKLLCGSPITHTRK